MTLTLRRRIILTHLPLLALLLIIGATGVVLLYRLGTRVDAILRENYESVIAMERLGDALERIDASFQFTLAGQEAKARVQYEENWRIYRENLRVEQGNITLPGENELVDELTALTERYELQGNAFYARAAADPRRNADYVDAGGLHENFTKIKSIAGQIARMNQDAMGEASRDAHRTAVRSLVGFAIGLAVCLALAVFAAWNVFHAVFGPIRAATISAQGISTGNLDQVVPYLSGDALGQLAEAFNHMTRRLREERQSTEERTKELVHTTEALRTEITERQQMERELRRMAAIVESSDDAIVGQSLDGIITTWNKGAERVFGHTAQEIVGQPQSVLVPPGHENELPAIRARLQRGERVDRFETVRLRKDGRLISVSLTVSPVRDEAGNVSGVASIARDITERKKADEALSRSEDSLKRAQAVAHIGSWHLNIARDELLWSDETYRIFGVPAGTPMTYEKFLAIIHPDDRNLVNQAWTAAMRGGPYDIEHRILVGANTKWIHEKAMLEFDTRGNVVGGIGTAHDITERKQAEEAVRVSEERTRMILDTANDPFITINGRSEIVDWNRQADSVFGWSREEAIGRVLSETIIPPQHREAHNQGMRNFLVTGNGPVLNSRIELTALRRDGTEFPVELLVWPVRTGGGLTISAFVRDITERKQAEERLRRSNRALVALSSCNKSLIRATDEKCLLQQICQIVVEKAGYRLCWVGYAEQDEGKTVQPVALAGIEEGYLRTANITWADTERGRGPTGTCIRTGRPALVQNMAADPRFAPWRAEALKRGYASCIGIPLVSDSTSFGALTIYASEPEAFGDEEVQLLTELAGDLAFGVMALRTKAERNTAVALQAAHEREAKIGAEIQQTLLVDPLPADLRGLRVAALSAPSQQIDGDFYYFYKHEDQRVDLIVADVMGKGIPAALLGAATKSHVLEALCHLLDASPVGVLPEPKAIVTLAHAVMAQHLIDLESFVTLCYVRLDPDRRTIEFVDAGHTGLIHCKAATGRCDVLHGDNLPLGFRKGEIYNQQSVDYASDDLLVLYSDGVTEARNPADELFGIVRLTECIESNSALEPEDLAQTIRNAVFSFTESESPTDDLTCVVIKIVESELPQACAHLEIRSDFQELGRARAFVHAFCGELPSAPLGEDHVNQLELAVTEACSNIMKHAYHRRIDQHIQIEAEVFPNRISIRLCHLGDAFDPSTVRQPRLDGTQESGFGVYLIAQCVDGVRYYRDERGRNCIVLTKNR